MKVTDYNSLYVMSPKYSARTRPSIINFLSEEWNKEPRGRTRDLKIGSYLPPYRLRFLYENKRPPLDYMETTGMTPIFSTRLEEVLIREGITGWSSYEITMIGKYNKRQEIPGFVGIQILGRVKDYDYSRSIPFFYQAPYGIIEKRQGLYFLDDEYDGSDFLTSDRGGYLVVTQRVKNIFDEHKFTGPKFTPLPEATFSLYIFRKWTSLQKG